VADAELLYSAISRNNSIGEIPEDRGFADLMKQSYPWAPFPVKSLPGWRANKPTSNTIQPSQSDWFVSWWNLAGQRPTTTRKSNKTVATGLTEQDIDEGFKRLLLPLFTYLVINIKWRGKIPPRPRTSNGRDQDAEVGDAAMQDADEIASEDAPSQFSGMADDK
jgi:hypothetical protein